MNPRYCENYEKQGVNPRYYEKIDLDRLHCYLWRHTDDRDQLHINQSAYSKLFGWEASKMRRMVLWMVFQGRLKKLHNGGPTSTGVYRVADPRTWRFGEPDTHAKGRRTRLSDSLR